MLYEFLILTKRTSDNDVDNDIQKNIKEIIPYTDYIIVARPLHCKRYHKMLLPYQVLYSKKYDLFFNRFGKEDSYLYMNEIQEIKKYRKQLPSNDDEMNAAVYYYAKLLSDHIFTELNECPIMLYAFDPEGNPIGDIYLYDTRSYDFPLVDGKNLRNSRYKDEYKSFIDDATEFEEEFRYLYARYGSY